jgi:predicted nucleotidyltransferase
MNNHCIQELKDKLEQIKAQYNIEPIFVGLFGSQCKGYAGPESDYDFYVPYIAPIGKYLQAVAVDTLQIEDKEKLPPQISFEISDGEKLRKIQLNFIDFPDYIRELTCANIDFNLALDNPYVIYCSKSVLDLIRYLAKVQFNLQKVKEQSLARVRREIARLKSWGNPESKGIPPLASELADGMYRILFAASTTHNENVNNRSFFY